MPKQHLEMAAQLLLRNDEATAIKHYVYVLENGKAEHRARALLGLAEMITPEAEALLIGALQNDQSVVVRRAAADGLYHLGRQSSLDALEQAMSDPDSNVATKAGSAFRMISNPGYTLEWYREGSILHLHLPGEMNNAVMTQSVSQIRNCLDQSQNRISVLVDYAQVTRTVAHREWVTQITNLTSHARMGIMVDYEKRYSQPAIDMQITQMRLRYGLVKRNSYEVGTFEDAVQLILVVHARDLPANP